MDSTGSVEPSPAPAAGAAPTGIRGVIARLTAWALRLKLVRAFLLYSEHKGAMLADSITYRALFSVFAAVLLGFSVAAVWLAGNPDAWAALVGAVDAAIPGLVGEGGIISDPDEISVSAGLSVAGIISLIALVGAALGAVGSLRIAVRTIADTVLSDLAFVLVLLRNLLLAVGIAAALIVSAGLTMISRLGVDLVTDLLGVSNDSAAASWTIGLVSLAIVFALDTVLIVGVFVLLSGRKAPARALWTGAMLGAVGLVVLQELSSLFIGGATSNPLLASFASLLALLIWMNFSSQVILIACAYIVTGIEESENRMAARFGAATLMQRRVQRAERGVATAVAELNAAREAETVERTGEPTPEDR